MPTDQMNLNGLESGPDTDMTISNGDSQFQKKAESKGHLHQSRNNDNRKYNTLNTEGDMDDDAYSKAVAVLDAKLASK